MTCDICDDKHCIDMEVEKDAEKLKRIQKNCDHDWEDIGSEELQCTYTKYQKIKFV